jgi:hypothetical protein
MQSLNSRLQWTDPEILAKTLTYYNYMMKSRTHGTTPNQATGEENKLDIKMNLEAGAVKKRKYPAISVGDRVRIYKKKGNFVKERYPVWSAETFKVERIQDSHGQDFYCVNGETVPCFEHGSISSSMRIRKDILTYFKGIFLMYTTIYDESPNKYQDKIQAYQSSQCREYPISATWVPPVKGCSARLRQA